MTINYIAIHLYMKKIYFRIVAKDYEIKRSTMDMQTSNGKITGRNTGTLF